jgi:ATP-dependent RNA helicase DHX37/DHR1
MTGYLLTAFQDTKLRKEENLDLIKKLAITKVDTSLLRSSKTLGRTKESKREILSRALREQQAGINADHNEKLLYVERPQRTGEPDSSSSDDGQDEGVSDVDDLPMPTSQETQPPPVVGYGLKRPLKVDETGMPKLKKRRKRQLKVKKRARDLTPEWNGFDHEGPASSADPEDISDTDNDSYMEAELDGISESTSNASIEEEGTSSDQSVEEVGGPHHRSSIFKAWATQQRNESLNYIPARVDEATEMPAINKSFKPRELDEDPLPDELKKFSTPEPGMKPFSMYVDRSTDIQTARLELPVVAEEQKIMEAINHNDIMVIWGATGSGKTTQIPQFLFEAGYGSPESNNPGLVGVTQPRRVAAVSMSNRVGIELGDQVSKVSYQVKSFFQSSNITKI